VIQASYHVPGGAAARYVDAFLESLFAWFWLGPFHHRVQRRSSTATISGWRRTVSPRCLDSSRAAGQALAASSNHIFTPGLREWSTSAAYTARFGNTADVTELRRCDMLNVPGRAPSRSAAPVQKQRYVRRAPRTLPSRSFGPESSPRSKDGRPAAGPRPTHFPIVRRSAINGRG